MTRFAFLTLTALFATTAYAQTCGNGTVSATWEPAGSVTRTLISGNTVNRCNRIEHQRGPDFDTIYAYYSDMETNVVSVVNGVDCNCDLVADGHEAQFTAPPGLNGQKLLDVCNGPKIGDPVTAS